MAVRFETAQLLSGKMKTGVATRGADIISGRVAMGVDIGEVKTTFKELTQRLNTIGGHL
jgi:hypothetical protein